MEVDAGSKIILCNKPKDFNYFRLFFIFTLWKSHISKRDELKGVSLGNKYANKAKECILKKDSELFYELDISIRYFSEKNEDITLPRKQKFNGGINGYRLMTQQYDVFIKRGSRAWCFLSSVKSMGDIILVHDDFYGSDIDQMVKGLIKKLAKQ